MILGVGVDLVTISRIESVLTRHGDRFLARVLSSDELSEMDTPPKANWVAKRFAVKEAMSKALGTGITGAVSFQNISLYHSSSGQPQIAVHGELKETLAARGVSSVHVSLSDEEDLAMAFIVIEGGLA